MKKCLSTVEIYWKKFLHCANMWRILHWWILWLTNIFMIDIWMTIAKVLAYSSHICIMQVFFWYTSISDCKSSVNRKVDSKNDCVHACVSQIMIYSELQIWHRLSCSLRAFREEFIYLIVIYIYIIICRYSTIFF